MSEVIQLRDRSRIAAHFGKNPGLHLYELGDLDPFFWPRTQWFGLQSGERLDAIVLQYESPGIACVLALGRDDEGATADLFEAIQPRLPDRYYAHLTPGLAKRAARRTATSHGQYLKLVLAEPERALSTPTPDTEPLTVDQRDEIEAFYEQSYPGNWFDQRMLETGQYYGVRTGGSLAAVAGIHVYSPAQRVAALGNIATSPRSRGRGLGRQVTARVCASALDAVQTVGLNVKADNDAALGLYRSLGFLTVGPYEEWDFGAS